MQQGSTLNKILKNYDKGYEGNKRAVMETNGL